MDWKKNQFGSENRTQKISIAGPQPINGGLKEKSVWVRKSDPNNIHRRPQPINGGLKGKNLGPKIGLKKSIVEFDFKLNLFQQNIGNNLHF